jgi:FixJ family two-component response regulator
MLQGTSLVVGDDAAARQAFERVLSAAGFRALGFASIAVFLPSQS